MSTVHSKSNKGGRSYKEAIMTVYDNSVASFELMRYNYQTETYMTRQVCH